MSRPVAAACGCKTMSKEQQLALGPVQRDLRDILAAFVQRGDLDGAGRTSHYSDDSSRQMYWTSWLPRTPRRISAAQAERQ